MSYKLTEEQEQYLSASKTVELTKQELTQKVKELEKWKEEVEKWCDGVVRMATAQNKLFKKLQELANQNTVYIKMLHDLLFEGLDEDPFTEPSH